MTNYVAQAEAIALCMVEKTNENQTVSVRVEQTLKGLLPERVEIRGETGHCTIQGPVSRFMVPEERYLVFLFPSNTVGRLGGILPIRGTNLVARYVDGFTGGRRDETEGALLVPAAEAVRQVLALTPLADRVRQADVIAMATVNSIQVQTSSEVFEYQCVTCTLTNMLKGKPVNNPAEVVLALKLKHPPSPDRLISNQTYLAFLVGDWSLSPLAPNGSLLPVDQVNDTMLDEIRRWVKESSPIRRVGIHVTTPSGWSADFRVHSGGRTTGGHMSGGPMPFHHMAEGVLPNPALSNLIARAEEVFQSPVPSRPEIRTNEVAYIMIETFDRKSKVYQRPLKDAFDDKALADLDKLLHQHRIGAW